MWPLDARHVADWLEKYDSAKKSFTRGFISRQEAEDALRDLRYRDEALRIELLEWTRARLGGEKYRIKRAREKLRNYIDEPRTPTTPSSI